MSDTNYINGIYTFLGNHKILDVIIDRIENYADVLNNLAGQEVMSELLDEYLSIKLNKNDEYDLFMQLLEYLPNYQECKAQDEIAILQ